MEKPMILKINELKSTIATIINESEIPIYCVEPIIKDIYEQIVQLQLKELQLANDEYLKSHNE